MYTFFVVLVAVLFAIFYFICFCGLFNCWRKWRALPPRNPKTEPIWPWE